MKWRWLALVLLLQVPTPKPLRPSATGSIEGTVVRLGNDEPVGDARVLLLKAGDELAQPAWVTGLDGRFAFRDLPAGTYRLTFASNGYVRQEYGQRVLFGKGTAIELAEGQTMKGVVVRMSPAGTVSGRIQDKDGSPLSDVSVELMRSGYDEKGKQIIRSLGKAQTNDLGEYRIYFVTPGRYYLSASDPRHEFAAAFYPGVRETRSARLIEITSGAEIRGIDLTLQRLGKPFVVRGRVIDASTGTAPENIGGLYLRPANVILGLNDSSDSNPAYRNGTFEFRDVAPGRYVLHALAYDSAARKREDRIALRREGIATVEVTDSNIDGIEVTLHPGFTVSGKLTREDGAPAEASFWNISTGGPPSGADLTPVSNPPSEGSKPDFSYLNEDGTFEVLNLLPGDYLFSIDWLQDQYVKEARLGGVDILNRPLRFTGKESGSLEIVLGRNMGVLEGRVLNERLEGVPAAQVVLVPDRNRERTMLFRAVTTDARGRFSIPQIVPGEYKLFAWEAIEPYEYFDPDLSRRSDSKGVSVHVGELSRQTLDVTVIPNR